MRTKCGEMETFIKKSELALMLQTVLPVFILHVRGRVTMRAASVCWRENFTSKCA